VIKAGEGVIVSVEAANRDPGVFEDPHRLRFDRGARHHLSFGYGVHQCLGQALARVELQVAIERTIRRFPTLRVAEGAGRIEFAHDRMIHGVHRLEVQW
jgi:cytochrome P450